MLKQFETILVFLFFFPFLALAELQYLGIDAKIADGVVKVKMTVFKPPESFNISLSTPVSNLSANAPCTTTGKSVKCEKINVSSLNLQFVTYAIEKEGSESKFYDQFILPDNVKRVSCILTLPIGAIVSNRSDAVFPTSYKTLSNGRNILVYWEIGNVSHLQPLIFSVYYKPAVQPGLPLTATIKVVVIVVSALIIFFVSLLRQKKQQKGELFLEVLDEYEKKVFELVRKHGRIKQRKIVELTGFSKARVSRIVKRLSKRGLIKAEKRGRTNIITLRKKIKAMFEE